MPVSQFTNLAVSLTLIYNTALFLFQTDKRNLFPDSTENFSAIYNI